ncbi:MAG: non-canonical purine NTP pyrophosphatase [Candidatus Delongbacteria bacterium]
MKLFIGSGNPDKIDDWRKYFPAWDILSYEDLGINKIEVEEGIESLKTNAEKKALAWAKESGQLTLSDDTGFFVNALGGLPGVSVKRWGGRFQKEMSSLEMLRYLQQEMKGIEDTSCYFKSAYAIADPCGKVQIFSQCCRGRLDRELLEKDFQEEFAFGAMFVADGFDKSWREMTVEEKMTTDREVIAKIEEIVRDF